MTKTCGGVKKFVFGLWRVPLADWGYAFFVSMMTLTFFWKYSGGKIEQLQNDIQAVWIFLLLGTLSIAWFLHNDDEEGGSDD